VGKRCLALDAAASESGRRGCGEGCGCLGGSKRYLVKAKSMSVYSLAAGPRCGVARVSLGVSIGRVWGARVAPMGLVAAT
jgi:hypothetical protein